MTNTAGLNQLTEQHQALENSIDEELARPMADSLKIAQLKREKLRIKEELAGIDPVN